MKRIILIVLVVAVLLSGVAAADPLDDIIDSDDEGLFDRVLAFVDGLVERAKALDVNPFSEPSWTAEDVTQDLQTEYNARSGAFETYVNSRVAASTEYDTIEIHVVGPSSEDRVYLVSNVTNGNYTESEIVDVKPDRSIDDWVSLCGSSAKNAPSELVSFYELFVKPDDNVTQSFVDKKTVQYAGKIHSSALNHTSRCNE